MHSRLTIALPLCLMALAAPVAASQPEGYAAKLLSNPLTVYTPAPEAGHDGCDGARRSSAGCRQRRSMAHRRVGPMLPMGRSRVRPMAR